jgi:acetyl-CoA carboxylase biotin carboxyl carrier protein
MTVELNLNELRELLSMLSETEIAEITLKSGDFELTVRKGIAPQPVVASSSGAIADMSTPIAPTVQTSVTPSSPPTSAHNTDKLVEITSPMVGTFYRSPAPEEPAFVDVGDRIRPGQTVCIVEAMKLMNEIDADAGGEIVEILVESGQPVEFGQVLMRVNPV